MLRNASIGFFGKQLSRTGTVTDIDGNVYNYITVGSKQWMVENLKTTKYADGTQIPNLTANGNWIAEDGSVGHDGAFCWYDNDIDNKDLYGALYNWYAVNNAHGLAPIGWSVASKTDFEALITSLGGVHLSGGKVKEQGTTFWDSPNTGATNEIGFKGRGSGQRDSSSGLFDKRKQLYLLWTSTVYEFPPYDHAYYCTLASYNTDNSDTIGFGLVHSYGFAVRCVRDI